MEKIYVCRRIPQAGLELLQKCDAQVVVHAGEMPPSRQELLAGVRGCTAILSLLSDRVDSEIMDAAGPGLRVISNFAVGFNNIDLDAANKRNVKVGNTPGVLTDATADIAVALLLAASRNFRSAMDSATTGGWRTWEPLGWIGQDLSSKTIGIVGMGRIGQAVARRLHGGWNMNVLYTAQNPKPEIDHLFGAKCVSLETLLSESDFVSIHLPLNDKTRSCIGATQLAMMKPTAVLINTARGEVIDQEALVEALDSGAIFAAGLDVCTPEPLPLDHPLHQLPNCVLLPHIGSATTLARNAMAQRSAENIIAGLAGKPLPYPVN